MYRAYVYQIAVNNEKAKIVILVWACVAMVTKVFLYDSIEFLLQSMYVVCQHTMFSKISPYNRNVLSAILIIS